MAHGTRRTTVKGTLFGANKVTQKDPKSKSNKKGATKSRRRQSVAGDRGPKIEPLVRSHSFFIAKHMKIYGFNPKPLRQKSRKS